MDLGQKFFRLECDLIVLHDPVFQWSREKWQECLNKDNLYLSHDSYYKNTLI